MHHGTGHMVGYPLLPIGHQILDIHAPYRYSHLVVATETRTVGKRAVGILLECCLVCNKQINKSINKSIILNKLRLQKEKLPHEIC